MKTKRELILVRSHYPHWAERSGYGLLTEYLQADHPYRITDWVTGKSTRCGTAHGTAREHAAPLPWYAVQDQAMECRVSHLLKEKRNGAVLHFMDGEKGYYYSKSLAKERAIKLAATYHQPPATIKKYNLLGGGGQVAALDRVVILSENQRPFFEQYTAPHKIVCIPHGVDTDYYQPSSDSKQRKGQFHCLTVGFWLRDLEALSVIARNFRDTADITFHFVGLKAGLEKDISLKKRYDGLRRQSNVRISDGIGDDELLGLYQSADLLLLPLLDATANNVILEGLSCGLPIVTTDLPATRFYLDDECAIFAPKNDTDALTAAIRKMVSDPGRGEKMGAAGRRIACETYHWERIANRYAALYEEMASKPPQRAKRTVLKKKAMCTIITSDYLTQAMALRQSISDNGRCDFFVLVADNHFTDDSFERVKAKLENHLTLLRISDLPRKIRPYENEDSLRWSLKPTLMLHLLQHFGYDAVICVDSDLCFFSDYTFLFDKLSSSATLLTPHWRPIDPEINEIQFANNFRHGLYNAGFVGSSIAGVHALAWWERVCQFRCEKNEAEGFYVDQRYLDIMPVYFDHVEVVDHKGCNVAEWNQGQLPRVTMPDAVYVQNQPVIFIHFTDITIDRIEKGADAALHGYYSRYRQYMDDSERMVRRERLELSADDMSLVPMSLSRAPSASPRRNFCLCSVVDFQTTPNFLLLLESLQATGYRPPSYQVLCADYESYRFLRSLNTDWLTIRHWASLDNYRLEKFRKRYERAHYHEGDHERFTACCTPFFLRSLLTAWGFDHLLNLDTRLLFLRAEPAFFNTVMADADCALVPGGARDYALLSAHGTDNAMQLIGLWENRISKTHYGHPDFEKKKSRPQANDPVWRRFSELERFCRHISPPDGQEENEKMPYDGEPALMIYDRHSLMIRDWQLVFPRKNGSSPPSEKIVKAVTDHLARVQSRFHFAPEESLNHLFQTIPIGDIILTAAKRGIDIKNVGRQINETWHPELSQAMKAYIIYLMATEYRDRGETRNAEELFSALSTCKVLLPDLYRSKTLFHLGAIMEQRGETDAAAKHYSECLKYAPFHKDAKTRQGALEA